MLFTTTSKPLLTATYSPETVDPSRRRLFTAGAAAAAITIFNPLFARQAEAARRAPARTLIFNNLHTGEKCRTTYFENGMYVPGALQEINHVLRDFRTGDVYRMDRELLNLLYALNRKLESHKPLEIISGYRSPKSNAQLHEHSNGVAKKSLHMQGMATDIRIQNVGLDRIRAAAKSLERGGVGYYPGQFVHVDSGKVRYW